MSKVTFNFKNKILSDKFFFKFIKLLYMMLKIVASSNGF